MQTLPELGLLDRLRAGDSAVLEPAISSVLAAAADGSRVTGARVGTAAIAGALGAEAARASLSPDDLFVVLDDAVRRHLTASPPGEATDGQASAAQALGVADAVVLLLWGEARLRYHDTRAALDAHARRSRTLDVRAARPAA